MSVRRKALALVVILSLGACTRTVWTTGGASGGTAGFDWSNPVPAGVDVTNPNSPELPFKPDVPDGLGQALRIQISPSGTSPPSMEIAFAYQDAQHGPFAIFEYPASATATQAE